MVARERAANEHGCAGMGNWRILTRVCFNAKRGFRLAEHLREQLADIDVEIAGLVAAERVVGRMSVELKRLTASGRQVPVRSRTGRASFGLVGDALGTYCRRHHRPAARSA